MCTTCPFGQAPSGPRGEPLATAESRARADPVPEHADLLHLELDDVAPLEPAAVAELEDAAGADGSRAEDLAWVQRRVSRGVRDDRRPRVVHVAELAARALLPVHARDHRGARAVEFVRGDHDGAEARREVLPLRGAEADAHLAPLYVAGRPVVQDGEAGDPALGADDRRHLELVVELARAVGVRDFVLGAEDRGRVGEVEDRLLVPLRRHVEAAGGARGADVLLEGVEVADGGRVQHGRAQVDLGERVLRVPSSLAAAGEEGLERLRRELDDDVALDDAGPAALEVVPLRAEHAQPHRRAGAGAGAALRRAGAVPSQTPPPPRGSTTIVAAPRPACADFAPTLMARCA